MGLLSRSRQSTDDDSVTDVSRRPPAATADSSIASTPLFRLGRALFGGILAFNAIDNFRNLEGRIAYAEAKGAPAPDLTVPAVSGSLLAGGIGIVLWRAPMAAAAAVIGFLAGITPVMHDFWNVDDDEQQQQELIHFLKNTALLGAAIAFLKVGQRERRS
ncbi:DoxX family protein [Natrononativus amylolyticus]|uniref:DoxX family protein n=1 Tax=Natrononativus amylolyticus TaxID=2963434 RepID=UPI0020CD72BE|nr:DoxX family protein [Natrononativus amylolyticus]